MIIVYDKRLPEEYKKALSLKIQGASFLPLRLKPKKSVYKSILYHPDIYLFQLDEETCIHAPCVSDSFLKLLRKAGVRLVAGAKSPHGLYPDTACYNAAEIGRVLLHNFKYTDKVLLDKAREKGFLPVNVFQGYARCSVLTVAENAVITQDFGLARVARRYGIDVLVVDAGDIILPGEEYGFIGGASGRMHDGTVVFLGDINFHSEAGRIKEFLAKYKVRYIDIENYPLYDAGTLLFF